MADRRLSSKLSSQGTKIAGTLALRVLCISLVLLVLPLSVNTFFLIKSEYRAKEQELFSDMETSAKLQAAIGSNQIDSWLSALALIEDEPLDALRLREIVKTQGWSSFFVFSLNSAGQWSCLLASDPAHVGKSDLFQLELAGEENVFLTPAASQKEFFLLRRGLKRALIAGAQIAPFFDRLCNDAPLSLQYTLLNKEQKVVAGADLNLKELSFLPGRGMDKLAVISPVEGSPLSMLITLPPDYTTSLLLRELFSHLLVFLFLIFVLGGGAVIIFTSRMARPLKELCAVMRKIGSGDFAARYKEDKLGFEINVLGRHLNRMIQSVLNYMEEVKKERQKRERLEEELAIGHEIQKGLFPREIPLIPGLEIASGFLPAKEVAGDFYDLFIRRIKDQNKLMIVIADAAGKGISACLYSLMLRSMLRSCATEDDLSTLICHANNLFCLDTGESGFFATAWVGIYNADTHLLQYASCGHHPAMLHRATGRIEELITKGIALGVTPLEKMETAEVLLHAGDTLLLYTDGVLEAHNPASTLFGKYRLHQLIEAHADGSAKQLVSQLLNEVSLFCEKTPQHDDITVLALKLT